MTWLLIAVNALVFLYEIALPQPYLEAFIQHYALVPARYSDPQWALSHGLDPGNYLPVFTNMFMHAGWAHVILNMWTLWIFGPAVEDRLGPWRYLLFYLLCGIGASLAQGLMSVHSTIPALGASGAIAGVMGAFMRMFPLARVVVVVPILFLPLFFELYAFYFVGFWLLLQLSQGVVSLLGPNDLGGVAWWAHVGGFAVGWIVTGWIARGPQHYRPPQPDEGHMGFSPDGRRGNSIGEHRKGPWS